MKELLQELWDEYKVLIGAIETATDDVDMDTQQLEELSDAIADTAKMKNLRKALNDAGVK